MSQTITVRDGDWACSARSP